MILHHVAQGAGVIVEGAAPSLHADRFRDGDLHVIHMFAVEERLEDGVAEAKRQQVLHRFLAEIMVDPVDLIGPKKAQEVAVEGQRAGKVVAERLFDDDARPGTVFFAADQSRAGQAFDDGAEELRVGRQVEQAIAGELPLSFQIAQALGEFLAFPRQS